MASKIAGVERREGRWLPSDGRRHRKWVAGALLAEQDAKRAQLVSMWTARTHRRNGLGGLLVGEVWGWAVQPGVRVIQLMVTSKNEPAMQFYEQLGFTRTGGVEPYPNDPSMVDYKMARKAWLMAAGIALAPRLIPVGGNGPRNKKGPGPKIEALAFKIIPAATYVPTQLPVQYHRPGEA